MAKKSTKSHRELIDTGTDKRFVRRNEKGQFDEVVDVGRSLAQDRKQQTKTKVPPGQGDRGDQRRKEYQPRNTRINTVKNYFRSVFIREDPWLLAIRWK